jgi:phenylpropionate dioxygenase-like ring-hydroxylating dioxygenase large terminal subunit
MKSLTDILSQKDLDSMRLPIEQASPPPAAYYTSKEIYELEKERIFLKEWLWVGHADQVQNRGDYFTFEIAEEPIVVVRDQSKTVRAFSAVCRHRGAVIATGEGNCKVLKCPYHNWTYSLTGKLIGAPTMNEVGGFDASQFGLISLKVEIWEGNVFVNFDPGSKPLSDSLGDMIKWVKNYKMADLVCTDRQEYDFPCNWKMLVENNLEGYHIPGTHAGTGEYSKLNHWKLAESHGLYGLIIAEFDEPLTMNVPGSGDKPVAIIKGITELDQRRNYFLILYPNMLWALQPDSTVCFTMLPNGVNRTRAIVDWHFPRWMTELPEFPEIAQAARDGVGGFNDQDMKVLGLTSQGYRSRLFHPGRYSLHERNMYGFSRYIIDRLEGKDGLEAKRSQATDSNNENRVSV